MAKQDDSLFLMEVLVDKIIFEKSPCFTDKDFRTCVTIVVPSVEPLEICDDHPGACIAKSDGPLVKQFNIGKSCLFSLSQSAISTAMSKFPVQVKVSKSLPCGCLPTKIIMGETTIDMTKEFVQARNSFLKDPSAVSYQAMKDSFRLVGSEKEPAGEITMFLRISCLGKSVITKFQGSGGSPSMAGVVGSSGPNVVDRSCAPRKDFQSADDSCACGIASRAAMAEGGSKVGMSGPPCSGGGFCPFAKDPYNSMPCKDHDPCFCSGAKPTAPDPMACRNTDEYCLHVPKGTMLRLPMYQELAEDRKQVFQQKQYEKIYYYNQSIPMQFASLSSLNTICSRRRSVTFSNKIDYLPFKKEKPLGSIQNIFGSKETMVYVSLCDKSSRRTSSTQATAFINKCLQVDFEGKFNERLTIPSESSLGSDYCSSCNAAFQTFYTPRNKQKTTNPDVFFFGRKKNSADDKKKHKTESTAMQTVKTGHSSGKTSRAKDSSTSTVKAVSIKDSPCKPSCPASNPQPPCPAVEGTKSNDMFMYSVSHIKIGPKEPCPTYGNEPCQGPKCIIAASEAEKSVPVKATNCMNPRRGVFELAIKKLTGAPLATNELLLEWTPPPAVKPCGTCPQTCIPCFLPCRVQNCRIVLCRPYPKLCKSKSCNKKPCGPLVCGPPPPACRKPVCCKKFCSQPCKPCRRPCKPRSRPRQPCPRPCSPSPCCSPQPCSPCPPICSPCPRPCGRSPPRPCSPCRQPCSSCARSCKPCPPKICSPCRPAGCRPTSPQYCFASPPRRCPARGCKACPPSPCKSPCSASPCCGVPCSSSPCIRLCPVGRKKTRKCRSQPKIKPRPKRISPCLNRPSNCPVVRCRSVPGPFVPECCGQSCPPRRCCSTSTCC